MPKLCKTLFTEYDIIVIACPHGVRTVAGVSIAAAAECLCAIRLSSAVISCHWFHFGSFLAVGVGELRGFAFPCRNVPLPYGWRHIVASHKCVGRGGSIRWTTVLQGPLAGTERVKCPSSCSNCNDQMLFPRVHVSYHPLVGS